MTAWSMTEPVFPAELADLPPELGLARAKILVVDDDERNALAITTVLKELGQTVVVANSGEEALRSEEHTSELPSPC